MKSVFYWCPYISQVATVRAVIKSAEALKKFAKNKYEPVIINVAGEWNKFKTENQYNIKIIDLNKSLILNNKNWTGFCKSRLIYIYIFLISFFSLVNLIKKEKPDYLIVQLISSLPLFLNLIFKLRTKVILRISGIPKLNFLRKLFWTLALKRINLITTPTKGTFNYLIEKNFEKHKLKILYDPIIIPSEINRKKKLKIKEACNKDYYISIGRLTKQKNFKFLVKSIAPIIKKDLSIFLHIFGDGEQKNEIQNLIFKYNLNTNIKLFPFNRNIYSYIKNARGLILSSLWEDPGFVLVEAAFLNIPILSSNCKNGPEEILDYGKSGVLFNSNNQKSFEQKFNIFHKLDQQKKKEYVLNAKRYVARFSFYAHYKQLKQILDQL